MYALGCSHSISQAELLKNTIKPARLGDKGRRGRFSGPARGVGTSENPK